MTRICARELADAGVRCHVASLLRVGRQVLDQSGLDQAARQANLAAAFTARGLPDATAGCPVILVDDIVTTGSTLVEMARAVAATGTTVLGCAVVAATQRRAQVASEEAKIERVSEGAASD